MSDGYAELHCLSNFSFQRGASSALELFQRAKKHGYQALAITDECTLAGIVRAWQAAKSVELPLVIGSEVRIDNGPKLLLLVENLAGYQTLCGLITQARRRTQKGQYQVLREDFSEPLPGLFIVWVPDSVDDVQEGRWLKQAFGARLYLAVQLHRGQDDQRRLAALLSLAEQLQIAAVASGDVHMHARGRRALQDTMTAIRHHVPVPRPGCACIPTASAICAASRCCASCIRKRCSTPRCNWRGAAPSILASCAMSIRESWCQRDTPVVPGCGN
jgi:error-prone DNA polymerase